VCEYRQLLFQILLIFFYTYKNLNINAITFIEYLNKHKVYYTLNKFSITFSIKFVIIGNK